MTGATPIHRHFEQRIRHYHRWLCLRIDLELSSLVGP